MRVFAVVFAALAFVATTFPTVFSAIYAPHTTGLEMLIKFWGMYLIGILAGMASGWCWAEYQSRKR